MAALGWAIVPVREATKIPFVRWNRTDVPSVTAKMVDRWWRRWPDARLGLLTGSRSGVFIVDVDGRDGGWTSLERLDQEHGWPFETARSIPPRSGAHFLFRHVEGVTNRHDLGRGIDVRGEGGLVVIPPSPHHIAAGAYAWQEELVGGRGPGRILEAPAWLLDRLVKPSKPRPMPQPARRLLPPAERSYGRSALEAEVTELAQTTERRNITLNTAAAKLGGLVAGGELTEAEVVEALMAAMVTNGAIADDGERAARATLASGLRAGLSTPRSRPERAAPACVRPDLPPPLEPPDMRTGRKLTSRRAA